MAKKNFTEPLSPQFSSHIVGVSKANQSGDITLRVPLTKLQSNPFQPRCVLSEDLLKNLGDSMKAHGLFHPLHCREESNGLYTVISGHRRWKAAELIGWTDIVITLRQVNDTELRLLALIENIQRENIHPVDQARAFQSLIDEVGTQEEASRLLNIKRSTIAKYTRILQLDGQVLNAAQEIPKISADKLLNLLKITPEKRLAVVLQYKKEAGLETDEDEAFIEKAKIDKLRNTSRIKSNLFCYSGKTDQTAAEFTIQLKFRKKVPELAEKMAAAKNFYHSACSEAGASILEIALTHPTPDKAQKIEAVKSYLQKLEAEEENISLESIEFKT